MPLYRHEDTGKIVSKEYALKYPKQVQKEATQKEKDARKKRKKKKKS